MNNSQQKQADKLKGLVRSPQWTILVEYLKELKEQQHRVLEQAVDVNKLYQAQGYINALNWIISIEKTNQRN